MTYEYTIIGDILEPYFFLFIWVWLNDYWFCIYNIIFKFINNWV